ncbi:MAG: prepilin peptidase [Pseudomonadota bacterium]|nr:prepilin peptidase [Pseudomonadota bacterium]
MSLSFAWILLGLLALMLLAAGWFDLRSRTIPNELCGAIALAALPFWWANGLDPWPDVALQIGVAALVFALFAAAFAIGAMGGGDVKLIAAVALWLPWQAVIGLLVIMSLAGGALTLALVVRKRLARSEGQLEIPYGVAIAFGGLWLIGERFLYQFG